MPKNPIKSTAPADKRISVSEMHGRGYRLVSSFGSCCASAPPSVIETAKKGSTPPSPLFYISAYILNINCEY